MLGRTLVTLQEGFIKIGTVNTDVTGNIANFNVVAVIVADKIGSGVCIPFPRQRRLFWTAAHTGKYQTQLPDDGILIVAGMVESIGQLHQRPFQFAAAAVGEDGTLHGQLAATLKYKN